MSSSTPEITADVALPWRPDRRPATAFTTDPLAGEKPQIYDVRGRKVAFYKIGALARVLNRKSDTIRGWEEQGWLPRPPAAFPGRDPRNAASAKHGRRRLYTKALIIGIYQIAREEGILEPHARPIQETQFTARVTKLFADHAAHERQQRAEADGRQQ
ncbi:MULTISPECIES: hypothetical protein [Streptosporangium]|uniref:HTH merR-type domain-containing protein n=1 Tax=Streptosporangium brasiliense TaxID=47480 RepID=A0ABT9RNL8_9ACTN|nr:hypothetical protein [Streptosporangium brasiliense]MDP9870442.1 hypothetical protein [Streptosporangium brasiliense]